jgi:hypothetical protein
MLQFIVCGPMIALVTPGRMMVNAAARWVIGMCRGGDLDEPMHNRPPPDAARRNQRQVFERGGMVQRVIAAVG